MPNNARLGHPPISSSKNWFHRDSGERCGTHTHTGPLPGAPVFPDRENRVGREKIFWKLTPPRHFSRPGDDWNPGFTQHVGYGGPGPRRRDKPSSEAFCAQEPTRTILKNAKNYQISRKRRKSVQEQDRIRDSQILKQKLFP